MNRIVFTTVLLALLNNSAVVPAHGSGAYNEDFSSGASGWQGGAVYGTGSWNFNSGTAKLGFFDTGTTPVPDRASVTSVTAPFFAGDYTAAGITLAGFQFRTEGDPPSSVNLEISGPSSTYFRIFYPAATGVWQTFVAKLDGMSAGGWSTMNGSEEDFEEVLRDVRAVRVMVARAGTTARSYEIDNVFVGRRPASGFGVADLPGTLHVAADELIMAQTYRIETTTNLLSGWTTALTFIATNTAQTLSLSSDAPVLYWRLLLQ